jgi:hypothetical protein
MPATDFPAIAIAGDRWLGGQGRGGQRRRIAVKGRDVGFRTGAGDAEGVLAGCRPLTGTRGAGAYKYLDQDEAKKRFPGQSSCGQAAGKLRASCGQAAGLISRNTR